MEAARGPGIGCRDQSRTEIDRVDKAPTHRGGRRSSSAILRAVDELVGDAFVTDETWSVLAEELDTQQLMDLIFTVGCYDLIAMFFKSSGVQVDDDLTRYLKK